MASHPHVATAHIQTAGAAPLCRALAILKVLQPAKGSLQVLQRVVEDEEDDGEEMMTQQQQQQQQPEVAFKPGAVPALALGQVGQAKDAAAAATSRSSVPATARGVQLEFGTPRAPAGLAQIDDNEVSASCTGLLARCAAGRDVAGGCWGARSITD